MKTMTTKSLLLLSALPVLMSCMGQSSDPMQAYSELKTGMPTAEKSETQSYALPVFTSPSKLTRDELIALKVQGTNEVNTANFLEGKPGVLYFKVVRGSTKITDDLVEPVDFPISSRPKIEKHPESSQVYGISWTPPQGVIPAGQLFVELKLKIKMTVTKATDTNLVGLVKYDDISLVVSRDNSVPTILGHTKLDGGIDEGQAPVAFTVDIEDPASAASTLLPDVRISSYIFSNTEAYRADGSRFVFLDNSKKPNPEKLSGSSKWRFHYLINLADLPLDKDRRGIDNPLSPSVDICFHVEAISVIKTYSAVKKQICFKGRYAAQAPTLTWENDAIKEIKAGAPTVLKFSIQSVNGLGQVSLKNANQQISGLTGKKDIVCFAGTDKQSCELTWFPTCLKSNLVKKLNLKIDNVTGKKTKSQTFTKEFVVVPSEENCPAPVAKAPAAKAAPKTTTVPATAKSLSASVDDDGDDL